MIDRSAVIGNSPICVLLSPIALKQCRTFVGDTRLFVLNVLGLPGTCLCGTGGPDSERIYGCLLDDGSCSKCGVGTRPRKR